MPSSAFGQRNRGKKRTPWEVYRSLQPIEGSGHGKRVAKSKEMLAKKFEDISKNAGLRDGTSAALQSF